MSTQDQCCSIVPYFEMPGENLAAFKSICELMVTKANGEAKCLYYGFSFHGDQAHCREGYADADGVLTHLGNVEPLLGEAMKIAELTRLEIIWTRGRVGQAQGTVGQAEPAVLRAGVWFRR